MKLHVVYLMVFAVISSQASSAIQPTYFQQIDWLAQPSGVLSGTETRQQWLAYKNAGECFNHEIFAQSKVVPITEFGRASRPFPERRHIFPSGHGNRACLTGGLSGLIQPITTVKLNEKYGERQQEIEHAAQWFFFKTSMLRYDGTTFREEILNTLYKWANANALSSGTHVSWGQKPIDYQVMVLIGALVSAFTEVITMDTEQKEKSDKSTPITKKGATINPFNENHQLELITGWLNGLVKDVGESRWGHRQDNKEYQKTLIGLNWALLTNDEITIQAAADVFKLAIHDMRPDGSFPIDSQRGGMGLDYNSAATGNLVTLAATLRESKSIDLFPYTVGKRSIHSAVRFVVSSLEDPSINEIYAIPCPEGGDRWGSVSEPSLYFGRWETGGGFKFRGAYLLLYASIFSDTETASKINALYEADWGYPAISEPLTGNISCLFNLGL